MKIVQLKPIGGLNNSRDEDEILKALHLKIEPRLCGHFSEWIID